MKSVLLFAFVILIVSACIPAALTDPTFEQVTIYPSEPLPLSTILFNATILSNESIDEVRLLAQECRDDLCFIDKWNESMDKTGGIYQTTITLIHKEATQIKYHIAIKSNETWFNSEITFIRLKIDEQNHPTENSSGNNSTPGFELMLLFISVGLIVIMRRKSLKEKK